MKKRKTEPIQRNVFLTCTGVGAAEAGALDAAGVEAAGSCGLVLGAGCVEGVGAGVRVGTAGTFGAEGRGVTLTIGASVRSNRFSWLAALLG